MARRASSTTPALSAIAPNIVPPRLLPRAIALSSIAWQIGTVAGPAAGGLLFDWSPSFPYFLSAALLVVSGVLISTIRPVKAKHEGPPRHPFKQVADGFRFIRHERFLLGCITLDLFAVLLGGATAMLPVFARDILMVGPEGLGFMRGAPAAGAALVAAYLSFRPLEENVGVKMLWAVVGFGAATIAFALSTDFWLSLAFLALLGAADMISVFIRSSLVQLNTPDDKRGRVSAISGLAISASNELGELQSGLAAAGARCGGRGCVRRHWCDSGDRSLGLDLPGTSRGNDLFAQISARRRDGKGSANMKAENVLETIGNTPHIRLSRMFPDHEVWVKCERANPAGSIKDRIALSMVEAAEASGQLEPGGTIVEPTSGNTGIGLAMVAAVKSYKLILVMPESMSLERRRLMLAYGASFDLTPKEGGMKGALSRAQELVSEIEGAWMPQQFENPANIEVHARTTAKEILDDFADAPFACLITGVGTGGHLTACAEVLKQSWPDMKAYAVEPELSPVISGGSPGPHPIQGVGAGFIPGNLHTKAIDGAIQVNADEAKEMARRCAREEGLLVGISSGATLVAISTKLAELEPGTRVLGFNYDTGERYLSVPDFPAR